MKTFKFPAHTSNKKQRLNLRRHEFAALSKPNVSLQYFGKQEPMALSQNVQFAPQAKLQKLILTFQS